jgi:rhodanese-related sulfurtransferase
VRSGRPGWDTVNVSDLRIPANTYYLASVNTNNWQAKTYNGSPSPIVNGPLTADLSYYGQPMDKMPGQSSYSWYFVDVIFIPDGPLPNLYVSSIQHGVNNGTPTVYVTVCNNGQATAAASTILVQHWAGAYFNWYELATPSLPAGLCTTRPHEVAEAGEGQTNSYYVNADDHDVVYESNESDNQASLEGVI